MLRVKVEEGFESGRVKREVCVRGRETSRLNMALRGDLAVLYSTRVGSESEI